MSEPKGFLHVGEWSFEPEDPNEGLIVYKRVADPQKFFVKDAAGNKRELVAGATDRNFDLGQRCVPIVDGNGDLVNTVAGRPVPLIKITDDTAAVQLPDDGDILPGQVPHVAGINDVPIVGTFGPGGVNRYNLAFAYPSILGSYTLVDIHDLADHDLFTVPTGYRCLLDRLEIYDASGDCSGFSVGVGWNGNHDVIPQNYWEELADNTDYMILQVAAGKVGQAGDILQLSNTVFGGSTTTVTVDVFGRLIV